MIIFAKLEVRLQVLKVDDEDADSYYNRAAIYYRQREWDKAIADLEAVIRLEPLNEEAKANLVQAARERARAAIR